MKKSKNIEDQNQMANDKGQAVIYIVACPFKFKAFYKKLIKIIVNLHYYEYESYILVWLIMQLLLTKRI